jgi:hypothetical protein
MHTIKRTQSKSMTEWLPAFILQLAANNFLFKKTQAQNVPVFRAFSTSNVYAACDIVGYWKKALPFGANPRISSPWFSLARL